MRSVVVWSRFSIWGFAGRRLTLARMAEPLPIYEIEADIVSRLKETGRLILSAPTGSGKSTQVPRMLLKHGLLGDGQVVVLQPRRLAARLLATRVAHEEGVQLGKAVGYLLISKDISDQIALTEEIKETQFYTRSLIESNIDALMTTDPLGLITDVTEPLGSLDQVAE